MEEVNNTMLKRIATVAVIGLGLLLPAGAASAQATGSDYTPPPRDDLAGVGANRPPAAGAPATGGVGASRPATQGSTAAGRLVRTGSETDVPVKVGVGLIAAGGLAVLTVRKRQQQAPVPS